MNGKERDILKEHGERLARIEEQNKSQFKMIKDIKKAIMGNGQEGILKTVMRHDTTLNNVKWGTGLSIAIISIIIGVVVKFNFF